MRMILGGCLAAVTAGGVYFVFTGTGSPSHCGPCISATKSLNAASPTSCPAGGTCPGGSQTPVVEVVDVAAALAPPPRPAAPDSLPFVSFDEPPFADPPAGSPPRTMPSVPVSTAVPGGGVVQAGFVAPAPRPRVVPDRIPPADLNDLPLVGPNDPF